MMYSCRHEAYGNLADQVTGIEFIVRVVSDTWDVSISYTETVDISATNRDKISKVKQILVSANTNCYSSDSVFDTCYSLTFVPTVMDGYLTRSVYSPPTIIFFFFFANSKLVLKMS